MPLSESGEGWIVREYKDGKALKETTRIIYRSEDGTERDGGVSNEYIDQDFTLFPQAVSYAVTERLTNKRSFQIIHAQERDDETMDLTVELEPEMLEEILLCYKVSVQKSESYANASLIPPALLG